MGAVQKGQECGLKYGMHIQSRKSTELLASSDYCEWLGRVLSPESFLSQFSGNCLKPMLRADAKSEERIS